MRDTRDELFRVKAAAARLDMSVRSVRRLMAEGKIAFVQHGHWIRIPLSSLNSYIADGLRPAREAR